MFTVRPGPVKKFEVTKSEALLDEDSCRTQQELANSMGVTQQAVSYRLKCLGMNQKLEHWVPYELKPRDGTFLRANNFSNDRKERVSFIAL